MYDAVLATHSETPFELLDPPELREEPRPYDARANGHLVVAGPPQYVWMALARAFPEELRDPAPPGAELGEKARLRREPIERWMAAQPGREALLARLERHKIACAPVVTLREALTGAFARERALLVAADDGRGGTRPVVRLPYRFSRSALAPFRRAPLRGEHDEEVLREWLGLDAARVAALRAQGVLGGEELT
jgi:CoA:oxalate CoA-transferase